MRNTLLALVILISGLASPLLAQTSWIGQSDNKWSKDYNWTNGAPDQNMDAIIGDANFTGSNQPVLDKNGVCQNLTIGNAAKASSLEIKRNLTIHGNLTIGSIGTIDASSKKTITIQGNWTNSGIYAATDNKAKVTFSGTNQLMLGPTTFKKVEINPSSVLTLGAAMTIENELVVTGMLDPTVLHSVSGGGEIVVKSTGTIKVLTATFAENYPITGTIDLDKSSIVDYASGAITQYISADFAYGRLRISGGSTKELIANLPVLQDGNDNAGVIYLDAGIFDLKTFTANRTTGPGGYIILAAGTMLRIGVGSEFPQNYDTKTIATTSTVEYYGNDQNIEDVDYGNLVFTGTSGSSEKIMPTTDLIIFGDFTATIGTASDLSFTARNNIEVKKDIQLGNQVTFNGASFTHTFGGDWTNAGVFNGNTSRCELRGTSALISGGGTNNFNDLHFRAAGITADGNTDIHLNGDVLFLDGGGFRHSDNGVFTVTGAGSSIAADGINFFDLVVTGNLSTGSDITVRSDLESVGSFIANSGILSLTGITKSIIGPGIISLHRLDIYGHITTVADMSIKNDLNVSNAGSFLATEGQVTFNGTSTLSGEANLCKVTVASAQSLFLGSNAKLGVSNALNIAGTLDCTTYTPNVVDYNGGSAQTVVSNTYYDLTLSNANIKTAESAMTITGDLTIATGVSFAAGSYDIMIHRNWVNSGTFIAGTSDVQFISGRISNIIGITTFNDFTVNKSTSSSQAFLKSNVTASNIIITSGLLDTESNSITTLGGRLGNGLIYGTVIHQHSFNSGTPYYFEGPQNSMTLTFPIGVTAISVTCRPKEVIDFVPGIEAIYREYNISMTGGVNVLATMRLHYEDTELNAFEEPFLKIYKHNSGTDWTDMGATSRDQTYNWVELVGLANPTGRFTCSGIRREVEWNGSVSSAWEDMNNWTTLSGSDMSNRVPTNQDAVKIGTVAFTNQPSVNNSEAVAAISFGSVQAATITMNNRLAVGGTVKGYWSSPLSHTLNVGSGILDIGLNLTLSDGTNGHDISMTIGTGNATIDNNLIHTGAASISFSNSGNLTLSGDYQYTSGNFSAGTGTMTYSGGLNQEVAPLIYNNLAFTKTNAVATIISPTIVNSNLTLSVGGEVSCLDSLIVNSNVTIGSSTTLSEENAHLVIGGHWINQGSFSPSAGSVRFSGLSDQIVDGTLFSNLIVDKASGQLIFAGNIYFKSDFSILNGTVDLRHHQADRTNSGGTLTLASGTLMKVGGVDNFPKIFLHNDLNANCIVEYDGPMTQKIEPGIDYGHLTLSNGTVNPKQLLEDASVLSDLTIGANATLELGAVELTLHGDILNQGSVNPTQSLVILEGTSNMITGPVDFNSLVVNGGYTVSSGTTTMTGDFYVENTGSINFGNYDAVLDGDLTNKGTIISSGTATFTGNRVQSIQLLNAISSSSTGIINFNGTVAPFISSTSSPAFATVNINNTGGITPSVPWTVYVQCTIAPGAVFNAGPLTHTFYSGFDNQGTVTSSGNLIFNPGAPFSAGGTVKLGGTSFTSTGDVIFSGTAPLTLVAAGNPIFKDITVGNQYSSGVTAPQPWNVTNAIKVLNGSTLHAGSAITHSIGNTVLNNGTIDGGTSLFSFTGITSSIDGIGSTNLHDLEIVYGAIFTLNKGISLTGDLSNDGIFITETGRNVRFTGTSQSVISGTAGNIIFSEMESDKSNSSTILSIPVQVEDQLTMTDGIILTDDTNILSLYDNAASTAGTSTSFVDGPMEKIGDDAFVFPLGDNGKWARLGMSSPALITDIFKAEFTDVFYTDTTTMASSPSPVLNNVSQHEFWEVDRVAGNSSIEIELFWEYALASGINDFSDDLVVAHWNGSAWENAGQSAINGGASGSVTSDPQSSFSPFTFGSKSSSSNPLPIELIDFRATLVEGNVVLNWATASEVSNDYFTIERSRDGINWEAINQVPGAGNSSTLLSYEDIDYTPHLGLSYYRLKQTDFEGTFDYSDVRAIYVNTSTQAIELKAFPNPTNGYVSIMAGVEEFSEFTVSSLLGRDVTNRVRLVGSSANVHRLDMQKLSPGVYILKFRTSAVKIYKN